MFAARHLAEANNRILIALMIESAAGARAADVIAAIDGVDAIMVGVYDLSGDLGVPGDFDSPIFLQALHQLEASVRTAGKVLAGVVRPGSSATELRGRGYRLITLGTDAGALGAGMQSQLRGADASHDQR